MSFDGVHRCMRLDACPLKKTATNLCFADGNPEAAGHAHRRSAGPR